MDNIAVQTPGLFKWQQWLKHILHLKDSDLIHKMQATTASPFYVATQIALKQLVSEGNEHVMLPQISYRCSLLVQILLLVTLQVW